MSAAGTRSDAAAGTTKGVSIEAVARAASVSTATVSRVLNSPGLVAPATAERVLAAVAQLRYRPNRLAAGLASRRSRVLGIALPDLHGEFFSLLICAAERHARSLGYDLLIGSLDASARRGGAMASTGIVEGMITMLTESDTPEWFAASLSDRSTPTVWIQTAGRRDEPGTVGIDQSAGTAAAVAHLVGGTAPDRCWYVGGHVGNTDSDARAAAFVAALRAGGDARASVRVVHGEFSVDWGWDWATRMLRAGQLAGQAVLAGNDEIAVGIVDAARDAGLRVPEDLRVVGFDNTRLCTMLRPTLSSVAVPIEAAAQAAVEALIAQLERPERPAPHVRLSTELVVRQSSRCDPGSAQAV